MTLVEVQHEDMRAALDAAIKAQLAACAESIRDARESIAWDVLARTLLCCEAMALHGAGSPEHVAGMATLRASIAEAERIGHELDEIERRMKL